jgi:hypothetical protein
MMPTQRTYWVHIRPDGSEQIFDAPPSNVKTLTIWVTGERWEITKTYNVVFNNEKGKEAALRVKPRGRDWKLHDTSEMFSTTWRRRRKG